ncbi:AAA family ATPase [Bacillus sinesaloumensis]|uniref:AAA family ATPase n=1 Tax=Litchfieldia sinesaloumensis TaxID=1926280 RepID=UPI00190EDEEB|nr:AAA family ATPase [Bacillus sinesaloumensis]
MLKDKIVETRKSLLQQKKMQTEEELKAGYRVFQEKFHPDQLRALNGKELLDTMFNLGNRDSLVYWLEFKNDDDFQTTTYGSISGGSAYKYILFPRSSDGVWMTGSGQNPVELTEDEALDTAVQVRNDLLVGAEIIQKIVGNDTVTESDYLTLQAELDSRLGFNMNNLGWVHKYYHLIYPDKIDDFHNKDWQKNALIKMQVKPATPERLYTLSGQLMVLAKQFGVHINHFTMVINELHGGPHNYIRVGTTDGSNSYWDDMYTNGYVAIGWPELGDLSRFDTMKINPMKAEMKKIFEEHYPTQTPQVIGRWTSQVAAFLTRLKKGTIVVAADGETILGIGKTTGTYTFREDKEFPHTIETQWLHKVNQKLPFPREGILTTVHTLKNVDNLLEIESILSQNGTSPAEPKPTGQLENLTGIASRIEGILRRKKQVILYGPPGTGKTYHAEKTSHELSARQLFHKSFHQLTEQEKRTITGTATERGTVRMCTFHPSYGYEDFLEGIKPKIVNENTLFELKDGIFKTICSDARNNPEQNYYLIIDEINRGDISRIFGELITSIESNKRGKEVILPLSNELFSVPENVYIIGTMNTADRSIALLDVALRRRFGFIELLPDYHLLEGVAIKHLPLGEWLQAFNGRIVEYLGQDARNLQIGHSYFLEGEKPIINHIRFKQIIEEDILPLIEEYCYGDYTVISKIVGNGIIDLKHKKVKQELFDEEHIETLLNALLDPTPELSTIIANDEDENDEDDIEESTAE